MNRLLPERPLASLLMLALFISMTIIVGETAVAEDRVTYRPRGASKPITMVGDIIDSTGRELQMMSINGNPQHIPADDIITIKTHYDSSHLAGIEAYSAGRLEEAASNFITAYDREPRAWVDREIAAWLVRCRLQQGDLTSAIMYFRSIISSDPYTRHWGIAPLIWSPTSINDAVRKSVRSMLVSSRDGDRLLAASILLFDGVSGTLAQRELNTLASDPNPRISKLARAQLWRVAIANSQVTENILQGWRDQIEILPKELRPGPQYLLGRGYLHLGDLRLAAAEFLKLTILYPNHEALTSRATLDAARAIERTGLTQEADLLYRELLIRFPKTSESIIAREKLAENGTDSIKSSSE